MIIKPSQSEWHVVNAILCGSLAAAAHFATRVNPRAMQVRRKFVIDPKA